MPDLTPDDRTAWRGIVTLLERGNVSELNIASLSRTRAVLAVDARLTALEAVVKQIAESEPISNAGCNYCGEFPVFGSGTSWHAADCVWVKCVELMK